MATSRVNSGPSGTRERLAARMAAENKYAPSRTHGAFANEQRRGKAEGRSFSGSPTKNAARRAK